MAISTRETAPPKRGQNEMRTHSNRSGAPVNSPHTVVPSDDGKRTIGTIRDCVFTKANFHSQRHLCRKHNAIGLDRGAFNTHLLPSATFIEVSDKDTDTRYTISVPEFEAHAIHDDLGWGPQMFCPLQYFQVSGTRQPKPEQLVLAFQEGGSDG